MARYSSTPRKINKKGQRVLVPTLYPTIPLTDSDRFIYPKDGSRLDNLAFEFYNDSSLWWILAQANGLGKGRTVLNPNFQIRIPGNLPTILARFNTINE